MGMSKILIFGHKKPDTDSVASAIGLSYLKNKLGYDTEPRILGTTNKETKYALNYFKVAEPKYLNDVKLQLKDVSYHKGFMLKEEASIYDGYTSMLKANVTGLPITDNNGNFVGLITMKDLSRTVINTNLDTLDTSYDNIKNVLQGEEVLKFTDSIKGSLLVAAYRSTTFMENVKLTNNMILIVGDRHSIIEYAINSKVKLLIISGNGEVKEDHLKLAKENKVNIIRTPFDTYHIARLVGLSNYLRIMISSYNPTKFAEDDNVSDILEINKQLKHTNYPVINSKDKCLGLLRIIDLNDKTPKKVILVDHNEIKQSVDGLMEADILEVIDHHNLSSLTTNSPINFRNMAVGSTSTIIYTLFKENKVTIPKNIAGLLLSGILSDTLILNSPTTTATDITAVKYLSSLCNVEYQDYGLKLLESGTNLKGMSKEDVLYNDFKVYTVNDKNFAIGQFFTTNFEEINKDLKDYIAIMNEVSTANNYLLTALYVTDILKKGSYVIYNEKASNIMNLAYYMDIKEASFIPNCLSRKKDVVPLIMDIFER